MGLMSEFTAKMVRGGMVTIPVMVRKTEKLEEGDYVKLKLISVVIKKK